MSNSAQHMPEPSQAREGGQLPITLSTGRSRMESSGRWKPISSSFDQFAQKLEDHREGKKDGPCFLQGECAEGHRKAMAMIANDIIGIDLDNGTSLEDIQVIIEDAGLEAAIYTTHSHRKNTSSIKRDHFLSWSDGEAPTEEMIAEYLAEKQGIRPHLLSEIQILENAAHTEEGIVIRVRHKPIPKYRVIFPLSEPFVFAERGGTQKDAIAEWKERYAGFASAMGFDFDKSCVDPARLFYLPRHPRGAEFGTWRISGKPVDLDDYSRVKIKRERKSQHNATGNAFLEFAGTSNGDDPGRYIHNGFNLAGWAKQNARTFEIEQFLTDSAPDVLREPRSNNLGIHVKCPFEAEHSTSGGTGTFVVNASDSYDEGFEGGFKFVCMHDACADRDRLDFIKGAIEAGWFTVDDLRNSRHHVELETDNEKEDCRSACEEQNDDANLDEETKMLNAFNERYAVVAAGSKVRILYEPDDISDDIELLTRQDFELLEAHKQILETGSDGKKLVSASRQWLKSDKRRSYPRGLAFVPGGAPPEGTYNLFRGFPIEPKQGDWSLLRDHIFHNICESDEDLFEWFMTWMAQLIQQPGLKPGSALVITGDKGTGKSTAMEYFGKLLGRHSVSVNHRKKVTGNFNAHISTALLMLCEEAFWADDRHSEGVLKDLITNPKVLIEKKGFDAITAKNYTRLVLISNDEWVVPASLGDERRFGVFHCSDARRGDIGFFTKLREQMDEEDGLEAMMYELLHYQPEAGNFDILRKPPQTQHLLVQQLESLGPLERFMLQLIDDGVWESDRPEGDCIELYEDMPTEISATRLRAAVREELGAAPGNQSIRSDFRTIERVFTDWTGGRVERREVPGKTNKVRHFIFPSMKKMREHLERMKGISLGTEE